MEEPPIEVSPRVLARIGGALYLIMIVLGATSIAVIRAASSSLLRSQKVSGVVRGESRATGKQLASVNPAFIEKK
jgi:hypothetical protein